MDNPNHHKDRWVSSRITERLKNNLVKTAKGTTYCLEGAMHSGLCRHYKTPQFIIMGFRVSELLISQCHHNYELDI